VNLPTFNQKLYELHGGIKQDSLHWTQNCILHGSPRQPKCKFHAILCEITSCLQNSLQIHIISSAWYKRTLAPLQVFVHKVLLLNQWVVSQHHTQHPTDCHNIKTSFVTWQQQHKVMCVLRRMRQVTSLVTWSRDRTPPPRCMAGTKINLSKSILVIL
jgi:hypothetical protein